MNQFGCGKRQAAWARASAQWAAAREATAVRRRRYHRKGSTASGVHDVIVSGESNGTLGRCRISDETTETRREAIRDDPGDVRRASDGQRAKQKHALRTALRGSPRARAKGQGPGRMPVLSVATTLVPERSPGLPELAAVP